MPIWKLSYECFANMVVCIVTFDIYIHFSYLLFQYGVKSTYDENMEEYTLVTKTVLIHNTVH